MKEKIISSQYCNIRSKQMMCDEQMEESSIQQKDIGNRVQGSQKTELLTHSDYFYMLLSETF